ncbi:MAG TPA: histidine kinase, partial [Acidimicrobiales bacterium]|nr:histidine kinase [Acidimicrobiales bacterium]
AAMEAAMEVEKAHTEVERARAEILAERNRLAREIHDVLAHTLAALSVQLEALSAVADTEGAPAPVVAQLDQTRQLVREGLEEARGAVRALRDDVPALVDQLGALCAQWGAKLAVTGQPRAIPADASVALYRVAQEAFTNAAKHAPGAVVRVDVSFEPRSVGLSVHNSVSLAEERPLSNTGGGFGLQGIRERVMLVGGAVDAGPAAGGWRVQARVPA